MGKSRWDEDASFWAEFQRAWKRAKTLPFYRPQLWTDLRQLFLDSQRAKEVELNTMRHQP